MKNLKHIYQALTVVCLVIMLLTKATAQDDAGTTYLKAMEDELKRNINNLHLEGVEDPFFISYLVVCGQKLTIQSTLGAITASEMKPYIKNDIQVLVGNYKTNNRNFVSSMYSWDNYGYPEYPVKPDYYCIRRELWQQTDMAFKTAGERLVKKISAMNQQVLDPLDTIAGDFSVAKPSKTNINQTLNIPNTADCEKLTSQLSNVFMDYPDIQTSDVTMNSLVSTVYFTNSEGSICSYPLNITIIKITASTITEDGEKLSDELNFIASHPDKLNKTDVMVKNIRIMADNMVQLKKAPKLENDYSGPVMFEAEAISDLFLKKMFIDKTGLYANRIPICLDNETKQYYTGKLKSLEIKLNRKVLPNSMSITLKPSLKAYELQELIGSYPVDAEGVIPKDNLELVKDGILLNLMNDRVPTLSLKESNGNLRISLGSWGISVEKAPGVVVITDKAALNDKEIRKKLIQAAQKEGLDYALIIRKTSPYKSDNDIFFFGGDNKKPILNLVKVYKISVKTGEETLVRGCELADVGFSSFKHIIASSSTSFIYNTMAIAGDNYDMPGAFSGIPVSIILPYSILFEEIDINKKNLSGSKKPPLVLNPVQKK